MPPIVRGRADERLRSGPSQPEQPLVITLRLSGVRFGSTVVVLSCLTLAACGTPTTTHTAVRQGSASHANQTAPSAEAPRKCTAADLSVRTLSISPATGEHGLILVFRDDAAACVLRGRPRLTFRDDKGVVVPLEVNKSNDYVRSIPDTTVRLTHGRSAFVLLAKYRCDLGDAQVAKVAQIRLRHVHGMMKVHVQSVDLARCEGSPHGPGQSIAVSPFVSDTREFQVRQAARTKFRLKRTVMPPTGKVVRVHGHGRRLGTQHGRR
jgi:hypothetical protein